jgi:uncharacterized lipoprotein YddW (UPF0748 family)
MRDRTPGLGLRSVLTVATAILLTTTAGIHAQRGPAEVRALWVVGSTLSSPASIAMMVGAAKHGGSNTLIVPVAGAPAASTPVGLGSESSFDPINEVIERAHQAGLRVHAWIDVTRVASAVDLPLSRDHDVSRHPEWLMVPRALAEDPANTRFQGWRGWLGRDLIDVACPITSTTDPSSFGAILFSYDGLTGRSRGTEYLSQVGRAAFMQ